MRKGDYCDKIFVSVVHHPLSLSFRKHRKWGEVDHTYIIIIIIILFPPLFDFSQNIIILRYFLCGTGWFLRSDVDSVLSNVRPERTEMAIGQFLDREQPRPWFQAHASLEQRREHFDLVQSQRRGKLLTLDQRIGQVPRRWNNKPFLLFLIFYETKDIGEKIGEKYISFDRKNCNDCAYPSLTNCM